MRALILVVVACLTTACAGAVEGWRLECVTQDFYLGPACLVTYVLQSPDGGVTLMAGAGAYGKPFFMVASQEQFCDTPRTTIRVDRNDAITFERMDEFDHAQELVSAGLLEQITKGSRVVVRVHKRPECRPRDLEIAATGERT